MMKTDHFQTNVYLNGKIQDTFKGNKEGLLEQLNNAY